MSSKKRIVVVLGMHRSGTSAITRSLQLLGVDLGEELIPSNFDNPRGYWEDADVVALNEEILRELGSTYLRLSGGSFDFNASAAFLELEARATRLVLSKIESCAIWGIKDPRICRALPFWQRIFSNLNVDDSYVIALRDPVSVAESLARRDGLQNEKAYYLWLEHVIPSVSLTSGKKRVFVHYDAMLEAPAVELMRIAEALCLPQPLAGEVAEFEQQFLDPSLRNSHYSTTAFMGIAGTPDIVKKLYIFLASLSASGSEIFGGQQQNEFNEIVDEYAVIAPLLRMIGEDESSASKMSFDFSARLAAAGHDIAERDSKLLGADLSLRGLQKEIDAYKEQDRILLERISSLEDQLSVGADLSIRHYQKEIDAYRGQADHLFAQINELDGRLADSLAKNKAYQEKVQELQSAIESLEASLARADACLIDNQLKIDDLLSIQGGQAKVIDTYDLALQESRQASQLLSRALAQIFTSTRWKIASALSGFGNSSRNLLSTLLKDSFGFDREAYLSANPDVAASKVPPEEHVLAFGLIEGRAPALIVCGASVDAHVTRPQEIIAMPESTGETLEHNHVVKTDHAPHEPSDKNTESEFDADFYLALYPDLKVAGVDPVEHYQMHGRQEGRLGCAPALEYSGDFAEFNSARDTVLVVSHEASRTGAPVLSLNLVQVLGQKYNVVALLLGGGMLESAFREAGAVVVGPAQLRGNPLVAKLMVGQLLERCRFKFALINSIESRVVLPALANHFVPTISLIHEFAAYTRPKEAFRDALFWSGEAIFSAQLTLESAHAEYPDLGESAAHILPQGRCQVPAEELNPVELAAEELRIARALRPEAAAKDTVVILGAGFVQLRKGVDLFIECAARVVHSPQGAHCRFVWVGHGYDPEQDVGYSVYLADQIRRAGLERHVFFVGETPAIDVAYQQADLLLLSSRLDPLPNVAIDAMAHGVPVVCFAKTTGVADFLIESGLGQECVASYLDTADMADKVLALIGSEALRESVSLRSQQASLERFDMTRYVASLEDIATAVEARTRQEQADVEEIEKCDLLRLDFFSLPNLQGASRKEAIRGYVRSWASGIARRKLFPGFHPGIYLEQHGVEKEGIDPLADYLRAGQPAGPWCQPVITCEGAALPVPVDTRVALHLHVYYPDLLPDMLTRLARNKIRPDLFVSIPTEADRDQVARLLQEYAGKVVDIQVVPNRGRDIGPFLTAFGAQFVAAYDIVGHLHTKKTADIKDELLGKTWYRFLLDNLLGDRTNMADIILGCMAADSSIGMVFPDDPYITSWSSNKLFAEQMSGQFNIAAADLPESFVFPVGTMFWARVDALRPVFERNLDWASYPEEPLPYDGSMLHALERLLPLVCANNGYGVVLTNVLGSTR